MPEPRPLTPAAAVFAARAAAGGQRGMMKLPIAIAVMLTIGLVTVLFAGSMTPSNAVAIAVVLALACLWAQRSIAEQRRLERVVVAARDDTSLAWSVAQRTIMAANNGVPRPELTFQAQLYVLIEIRERSL
jgi:hypothetical protein